MKKLGLIILAMLAVLITTSVAAYQYFGGMGLVGVMVMVMAGMYGMTKMAGKLFESAIKAPFKMKGSVLKNACVEVNSVKPASPPSMNEMEDRYSEEMKNKNLKWYQVDVTVKPNMTASENTPFKHWEPGELRLVAPDTTVQQIEEGGDHEEICEIAETKIWEEHSFVMDEGFKFDGERRVLMLVGVKPETEKLKFQYYFELFGELNLASK